MAFITKVGPPAMPSYGQAGRYPYPTSPLGYTLYRLTRGYRYEELVI